MALNGTLADLGITDLVQFPTAGRKTGELVLAGSDAAARLYYAKGKLVHASLDDLAGMDVLVEIVGWTEGDFEFRLGVETEQRTIELELHRALMQALKVRDEREEQRRKQEKEPAVEIDQEAKARLEEFLKATDFAVHVCLIHGEAEVVAEADASDPPERIGELRSTLRRLAESYPDGALSRAIIEQSSGTVVVTQLARERLLIVVAAEGCSLGAVARSVGKLAAALDQGASG